MGELDPTRNITIRSPSVDWGEMEYRRQYMAMREIYTKGGGPRLVFAVSPDQKLTK